MLHDEIWSKLARVMMPSCAWAAWNNALAASSLPTTSIGTSAATYGAPTTRRASSIASGPPTLARFAQCPQEITHRPGEAIKLADGESVAAPEVPP